MREDLDVNNDTELLTAYLDNELEANERAALERRLVDDETLRLELRDLRRAWDLLDDWPEVRVSGDFTTTTMRIIAQTIATDSAPGLNVWSWKVFTHRIVNGLLCKSIAVPLFLVLVAFGVVVGYQQRVKLKKALMIEVATSAVLPTLKSFPDWDVPRQLANFPMLDLLARTELSRSTLPWPPDDVNQIRQWLNRLDAKDKELLRSRVDDFQRLQISDQQKFVADWRASSEESDSERLRQTASLFAAILQSMESGKRAQILTLPVVDRVQRLEQEAYLRIALWYSENMDQVDRRAINSWVDSELTPLFDTQEIWEWLIWMDNAENFQLGLEDPLIMNSDELISTLTPNLSDSAQQMLNGVARKDRGVMLLKWIMYAEGLGAAAAPASIENLIDVYKQLPTEQQELLDLQPSKQVERVLSGSYKRSQVDNKVRTNRQ